MVEFEVTSEEACLIGGLGEFAAGETKVAGESEQAAFQVSHGYPLGSANFPPSVSLVAVNEPEAESEVEVEEVS